MNGDAGERKLKLDLHTHCNEATGFQQPDERIATLIAQQIRACGLDGIAVTAHDEAEYGFRLREVMARCHPEILIIPGREVRWNMEHVVELYLENGLTFRFIAHPGTLWGARDISAADGIHGIEIANGLQFVHEEKVRRYAADNGLLTLANSDAHRVVDIGCHYNEVSLGELSLRARGLPGVTDAVTSSIRA